MTPHNHQQHTNPENLHTDLARPQALIQTTSAPSPVSTDVLDLGTIIMFQGFWWTMLLTGVGIVVCLILGVALCIYRGRLRAKNKVKSSIEIEMDKSEVTSPQIDSVDNKSESSDDTLKYPPQITKPEDAVRKRDEDSSFRLQHFIELEE